MHKLPEEEFHFPKIVNNKLFLNYLAIAMVIYINIKHVIATVKLMQNGHIRTSKTVPTFLSTKESLLYRK